MDVDVAVQIFSRLFLFFLSIFSIVFASHRVIQQEKITPTDKPDIIQTLTWYHVIAFPLVGSLMLLTLFYLFDYIQFIFSLFSICMSAVTVYTFFQPLLEQCNRSHRNHCGNQPIPCHCLTMDWNTLAAVSVSLIVTLLWVLTGHWLLLDFLSVTIATFMIQFVRLPSLKLASILLIFLLVYDVFWVFLSSSIFKANVMVEVAVKKAKNPVAVVADTLNMPEVSQSQPFLSLPGKLLVPSSYSEENYSMLGLGDIVLPGLLLCLAMRFDHLGKLSIGLQSSATKCRLVCGQWKYFSLSIIGYAIGLIVANVMVELVDYPQPALLYLVPCILLPLIMKAIIQGHFQLLWHGPFNETSDSNSTASSNMKLSV